MKALLKTLLFSLSLLLIGCKENVEPQNTGTLKFKMINPVADTYFKKQNQ